MNVAGLFTGLFTGVRREAYSLPHPALPIPVILLIRRVLCRAFAILREERHKLGDAKEDEITAALRSIIENNLRQTGEIPGFNRRHYEPVARQGQVTNFDGTKVAKSPDLCFKLRYSEFDDRKVLSEFDALFVECKPVDASHSVGARYCDDGLIRFVNGDYAWAMQQGVMLAYTRNNRSIMRHLIPSMREHDRMISLATVQLPRPFGAGDSAATSLQEEIIHVSEHRRDFMWQDDKGAATNITIYHLWHDCSNPTEPMGCDD